VGLQPDRFTGDRLSCRHCGSVDPAADSKKQIRSATVSANRQAWINTLRDNLATIRAYSSDVRELRASYQLDPALTVKIQEEARQAKILIAKVDLSLNPNETGHQALLRAVQKLWNISDSVVPDNTRAAEWEALRFMTPRDAASMVSTTPIGPDLDRNSITGTRTERARSCVMPIADRWLC
jgi:hypothetical protein